MDKRDGVSYTIGTLCFRLAMVFLYIDRKLTYWRAVKYDASELILKSKRIKMRMIRDSFREGWVTDEMAMYLWD